MISQRDWDDLLAVAKTSHNVCITGNGTISIDGFMKSGTIEINLNKREIYSRYDNVRKYDEGCLLEAITDEYKYWQRVSNGRGVWDDCQETPEWEKNDG